MVDMRPTVDDEINAAWAETNRARRALGRVEAERDRWKFKAEIAADMCGAYEEALAARESEIARYRQALGRIAGGTCGCYDDEGTCDACIANAALGTAETDQQNGGE